MGLFKIDVQGALTEMLKDAAGKIASAIDADGDGQSDLKQLTPMVDRFGKGAQLIADSIDIPAFAANSMKVASDLQITFADVRATMKTFDSKKIQEGCSDVFGATGDFAHYVTKAVASFHK